MSEKLKNNGLWESSRMILPEQREALIARKETEKIHPMPTREELTLVRAYATLPFLANIVEKNLKQIELSSYTLKPLYISTTLILLEHIHTDFTKVKKTLKQHNIRIFNEETLDAGMKYKYICNGYEGEFTLIRDVLRAEIGAKLNAYIHHLFDRPAAK